MCRQTRQTMVRAVATAAALTLVSLMLTGELRAQGPARPPAPLPGTARIPGGAYVPLYREPSAAPPSPSAASGTTRAVATPVPSQAATRRVDPFDMDILPVTNADYLEFVQRHPEWRRSRVKKLFAEASYLAHWRGDLDLGPLAPPDSPVVNVSWFAARAYLRAQGKDLPTVDQWEYVAAASDRQRDASRNPVFIDRLRVWYGQAVLQPLPPVSAGFQNAYGVRGLHGLIWEWTLDFNSALVTGESRGDTALERTLYCGSGASGASDFENYPAFMRYALRSSLQARYSLGSLGFRGVRPLAGDRP